MPELSYLQFQTTLKSKKLLPLYLFYGDEDFLIEGAVDALVDKAVDPAMKSFNLDVVYGSKTDARSVVAIASSFPMMSERRAVVVKEFERLVTNETSKEILGSYIQLPLESTCLILVSDDPDFRRKPFTDLKKKAVVVECKPMYDNQIPPWIVERVRSSGKTIELDACHLLQAYTGNSLRSLQNEIDKLFVFIGDRASISAEDVSQVVGATRGYTVFDLQNSVGRKDMKDALRILERMLETGESPQLIIVMLTRFFHQLWKLVDVKTKRLTEAAIAAELHVPSYYAKQYMDFGSNFTPGEIENGFRALLAADVELKTSSRDTRLVLDLLLYSLIRASSDAYTVPAE